MISNTDNTGLLHWTGERYLPEISGKIALEHTHRYLIANSLAKGKKVLDIACGEGYGSAIIAETADYVYGVDISTDIVDHAKGKYKKNNLSFLVGSCDSIPLPNNSVDLVVSFETIEHHDQHEKMMHEIKRVLKQDGVLLISSPDKYEFSDVGKQSTHYHVKELYQDEFEKLMHSSFKNVVFAGQRVVYGSAIFFDNLKNSIHSYNQGLSGTGEGAGLLHPLYFIAAATDQELPDIKSGLLEISTINIEQEGELLNKQVLIINEKDRQLHQRNLEVEEKDRQLHQRNLEVEEKDRQLNQRNLEVEEKDRQLHLRNLEVEEKDRQLHQRNLEVEEKDRQLNQRNLEVEEKDRQLHQRNLEVEEKDRQLHQRNLEVEEKDRQLHLRNLEVEEKDRQLHQRNLENQEKAQILHEQELELSQIKNSFLWKVLSIRRLTSRKASTDKSGGKQ